MAAWSEVHWHEGMLLRPHSLQAERRWLENVFRHNLRLTRPFAWGALELGVADDALENHVLRLDECLIRMKDGTWVRIPDNTWVEPLHFESALNQRSGTLDILLGIPQLDAVRPNSVSLTTPQATTGTPRYEPTPVVLRDENSGDNPQQIYMRRIRGRLFFEGQDVSGYETVRLGTLKRSDKPGAVPEFDPALVGPFLAIQGSRVLSRLVNSLIDQIEAKNEVLAQEALETRMSFGDGVSANTEHLLKLHVLNGVVPRLRAVMAAPLLHPFDVYLELSRTVGELSIFDDTLLRPEPLPAYDHDYCARPLSELKDRIVRLLDMLRPLNFARADFVKNPDPEGHEGLAVELKPAWIQAQYEMYIAFESSEFQTDELLNHIYAKIDMKLASPKRSSRIRTTAVRGLKLRAKPVKPGTLPRRTDLHYYQIEKVAESQIADYWRECEYERGIRMSIREGHTAEMEKFRPALYVSLHKV